MKRMHQEPVRLYDVYDYYSDQNNVKLLIIDFTKTHGVAPCEINLYIPSALLPGLNDDFIGNLKVNLTPYYPNVDSTVDAKVVFLGYQMVEKGFMLCVQGFLNSLDNLELKLRSWNIFNGEDNTPNYIITFEQSRASDENLKISYSVHEISRDIIEVKDTFR